MYERYPKSDDDAHEALQGRAYTPRVQDESSVLYEELVAGLNVLGADDVRIRVTSRSVQVSRASLPVEVIRKMRWRDDGTLLGFEALVSDIETARRCDLSLGGALVRFFFRTLNSGFWKGEWRYGSLALGGVSLQTRSGRRFWFSTSRPDEVLQAIASARLVGG